MLITKQIAYLLIQLIINIIYSQWALVGVLADEPAVKEVKPSNIDAAANTNFLCLIVFCPPAGDGYTSSFSRPAGYGGGYGYSSPSYGYANPGYGYGYSNPGYGGGYGYSPSYYPSNYGGYSSYGSSSYYCYYSPIYCYGYGK